MSSQIVPRTGTITPELIAAAQKCHQGFEKRTRDSGDDFYILKDGYPGTDDADWIRQLVFDAHGTDADGSPSFFPDDWRYEFIFSALAHISDAVEGIDATELANEASEPDIYTHDRLCWLASNLRRAGYCDEAREEFDLPADMDITERIGWGQMEEKREVFEAVLASLADHVEERP